MSVLVTGATGFLGREIVHHLLRGEPDAELTLLVRGKTDEDAVARGDEVLSAELSGDALENARKRVKTIRADLQKARFGLEQNAYDALAEKTTAILHGAASVSFTLPLEEARDINVEGTRRIFDFAKQAKARTDYIGTAYVAGERRGVVLEDELDAGQSFRNTYEQTKMEAETLARERAKDQPIAIFRPSIIVGDSTTGRTSSFKVLYWPLKIFARGLWRVVPGRAGTRVDVVPVDYVVRAMLHVRRDPQSLGRSYHLAAGPERSATLAELSEIASSYFGCKRPIFVNPELFIRYGRPLVDRFAFGSLKRILTTGRVYTPYLSADLRFDTQRTDRALEGTDIEVPRVQEYFAKLFRYCIESDWGKRPLPSA